MLSTYLVAYNVTDPQRRQLRSSTTRAAVIRRTRTPFGKRALSGCGPDERNSLPVAVRNIDSEKALRETQTLRAGCSKAEPKKFAPPQTPFPEGGRPKFNQLEMVTTFTYKPSLVRIDARNFELSW